jgi:hypothetical protein
MYKDILKRKKEIDMSRYGFDRTKPAEEPKEPKRNEPKIKITGDDTGELAFNLREAEREQKTEATEEAKKVKSYLSLDLGNELEGMNKLSFSDELKKLVDRLASESEFYFEKGEKRQENLSTQLVELFYRKKQDNKLSPGKLFRTIETSNKFTLDKFNEKLSKEMMKIGKKNYPIIHVLAAIAYDGDPDGTLREAYDDASEFLEKGGKLGDYNSSVTSLTEGLNGYKFLQQLAGALGTDFPTMTLGRTKGRIDRNNPSAFYVSDRLM